MDSFLVITALGEDRPGIVDKLTETVVDCQCNVIDSRMSVLGGEFAVMLLVSGKWNQLAKLEDALQACAESLGLTLICKRTEPRAVTTDLMPYSIEVISIDQPGIVHELARFFSSRNINIQELSTTQYAAAHTGTPMFALHLTANIPASMHIAALRDEFLDFCETQNMDATMEPMKP
ncbi:MAG TPA: glycine cleavage system protein R [Gammaproteobacteria bacterium]|nr:glycine cleavage system protein R [Gammaproteobacteria bacterium]